VGHDKKQVEDLLMSVVIPVYNVDKYLDRCIESIISQTYKRLEIIVIDDGSTDSSSKKCDEWARKDNRIRVIHKENEGLGEARNTGIENAKGDYICFVDSDDYINENTVEESVSYIKKYNAEIVCYGFIIEDAHRNITNIVKSDNEIFFEGKDKIREEFIPGMIGMNPKTGKRIGLWMSLCGGVFSLKLIKNSKWKCESERNIISEDVYSLLELYGYTNKVVVTDRVFYHYCRNEKSLTHTYRADRYEKIKQFYDECIIKCEKMTYPIVIKQELCQPYLDYTIETMKQIVASKKVNNRYEIKKIIYDRHLQNVLSQSKKNKWPLSKKILFFAMRHYLVSVCIFLLLIKTKAMCK